MPKFHAFSRAQVESQPLPGPSAVVCMADTPSQLATIHDAANVRARADFIFNDSGTDYGLVRSPSEEDAKRILEFVKANENLPHVVFQCQVGVGRSLAARAALETLYGMDATEALHQGTHNRKLHRKLLAAAGVEPPSAPKVSLVVRVKYEPDRMLAFLLAIQRQRYDNWQLVFVTDGPNAAAREIVERAADARITVIETEEPRGKWGHPYRQRGIAAADGEFIGLSNDDNYYVPGYFEQMVNALQKERADLALCGMLHSYWGWRPIRGLGDVGAWIARGSRVLRWSGRRRGRATTSTTTASTCRS